MRSTAQFLVGSITIVPISDNPALLMQGSTSSDASNCDSISRPVDWYSRDGLPTLKVASAFPPKLTFGRSKGLGFDRVVINPTEKMIAWLEDLKGQPEGEARAKLYVALTWTQHVIALAHDLPEGKEVLDGLACSIIEHPLFGQFRLGGEMRSSSSVSANFRAPFVVECRAA
ncbi:hypothetical protein MLE07_24125 [Agrobacterium tumefaciens]|nr:hypothetical protein [Agrobacterium tumefaciens]UNZ53828.1 hypothetical protein MLE07_24125 [Agrobacterium tumefaciens]